ncbi:DUF4907 domain-containing protein [Arenibacter sp. TNZ]|jgi:hypothetical protein|uniref:DUF4907 domain-containing protein n=1 Tax=Arenibacter TaxID=178469 RepID=UPI000CD49B00|nr:MULTISPECIES: DUF4907 domain-containing protein [Arenibacter]MCM4170767.1 DUF4907 domain-containing protein [Arenibacter sp. TNZ]
MKKILIAYVLIAVVSGFLLLGFSNYSVGSKESKLQLRTEILNLENGYGYQIALGNKVLIRQEYIPVLPGKKPFVSTQDAKRTADKVINKLQNKESPILTISELEELQIMKFTLD